MSPPESLRIVAPDSERVSITELFHRLNSVLPDDQVVVKVPPDMKAAEAIQIMKQHGFSQLPVVVGSEVLGLFSYRSFAQAVIEMGNTESKKGFEPGNLPVDECIEKPSYARVTDEFNDQFDALEFKDAVLIGEEQRLQGIVTAMDILRYLYGVANPFVLVEEIELALRALIHLAVDDEELAECAQRSLANIYKADKVPTTLEKMAFHDYVQIVGDVRNWPRFATIFGSTRERTRGRLEQMGELRNDVFHLREVSAKNYEKLASHRDWMLMKARATEARARGGDQ